MAFSGISCFNSGVRTFSFPGPEFIDYPQDENKGNDGFLKDGLSTKSDSALPADTSRIDEPPSRSHHSRLNVGVIFVFVLVDFAVILSMAVCSPAI